MANTKLLPSTAQRLIGRLVVLRNGLETHWDQVELAYKTLLQPEQLATVESQLADNLENFQRIYHAEMNLAQQEKSKRKTDDLELKNNIYRDVATQEVKLLDEINELETALRTKRNTLKTIRKEKYATYRARSTALRAEYDKKIDLHKKRATSSFASLDAAYTHARESYVEALNLLQACWNEKSKQDLLRDVTKKSEHKTARKQATVAQPRTTTV